MTSKDDKSKGHDSILDPSTEPTLVEPIDPLVGKNVGKYQLISHIAQGGTATVYRAVDTVLNREVAVKILHEHLGEKKEIAIRFKKEAQLIAQLRHPNVLTVYDFTEFEGRAVLVVEYMPGITLSSLIKETNRVPEDYAFMIGLEILQGLRAAHEKGITHRDVKPANVLLHPDLGIKISDFGLAKIANFDDGLTKDGIFVGTPSFSSPEQIEGRPIDARSDLFSFGLTLYILATRQHAFKQKGDSTTTVWFKIVKGKFEAVQNLDASLSADLERVISRCLQVDVTKRYQSAQEVINDIEQILTKRNLNPYQEKLKNYLRNPGKFSGASSAQLQPMQRKNLKWLALGGILISVIAAVAWFSSRQSTSNLPPTQVEAEADSSAGRADSVVKPDAQQGEAAELTSKQDETPQQIPKDTEVSEEVPPQPEPKKVPAQKPSAKPIVPPDILSALSVGQSTSVLLMGVKSQPGYRFQWTEPSTFLLARDAQFKNLVLKYTEFYRKVDVPSLSVGNYFWKAGREAGSLEVLNYKSIRSSPLAVSVKSSFGEAVDLELNPWTQELKLDWSGGPKASTYVLEVATDFEFKKLLFRGALVQTSYSLERNFESNQTIFWRVSYEDEGRNIFFIEPIRKINLKLEGHSPVLNLSRIGNRSLVKDGLRLSIGAPSSWALKCQSHSATSALGSDWTALKKTAFLHEATIKFDSASSYVVCRYELAGRTNYILIDKSSLK